MSDLLKSLPKKIKISFDDVSLVVTDDVKFREENYGTFESKDSSITIADDLSDTALSNTLLHEIVHAAVWYGGLKDEGAALEDDKVEENVVNVISNQLCQIFRDNPKILTLIKKGLRSKNGSKKPRSSIVATPEKVIEKYTFHKNRK